MDKIKTRFAPSPTGYLHVGGARTALFNFLLARQAGGTFLLRIEDTDRTRHDEAAVAKIIEDMRWLGLHWDEGPEAGGDNGPYRQSQRVDLYSRYVEGLIDTGKAYFAFETPEELDAMRARARADKGGFRYPRPNPLPSAADARKAKADGRPVVVRFLCPNKDVTIRDDAFGEVTTPAADLDDFVIQKADGWPTYHLANVVDDALMGVTLVCRGQEFLGQTWRQSVLREALGFEEPRFVHLPLILDMKGRKLSKRDGDVEVHAFRVAGYLPETMVNFLALLGWNPGGDREKFTLAELIDLFAVERIGKTNAKFDRDKLLAFNTDAVAAADEDRLLGGLQDFLGLNDTPIPPGDQRLLRHLIRSNRGFRTFADIPAKCGVLFVADDAFDYDANAIRKVLLKNEGAGFAVLADLRGLFDQLARRDWSTEAIKKLLDDYCRHRDLGMAKVAQPVRLAVTGRLISPSIHDTLMILGRPNTLARIDRCLGLKK